MTFHEYFTSMFHHAVKDGVTDICIPRLTKANDRISFKNWSYLPLVIVNVYIRDSVPSVILECITKWRQIYWELEIMIFFSKMVYVKNFATIQEPKLK